MMLQRKKSGKEASNLTGLSTRPHAQPSEEHLLPDLSNVYSQSLRPPSPLKPLPSSSNFRQSVPLLALTRLCSHQKPLIRAKKMTTKVWRRVATPSSLISIRKRTKESMESHGPMPLHQRPKTWELLPHPSMQAKVKRKTRQGLRPLPHLQIRMMRRAELLYPCLQRLKSRAPHLRQIRLLDR